MSSDSRTQDILDEVLNARNKLESELAILQKSLLTEFRGLAKLFIEARMNRINTILEDISLEIFLLNEKSRLWQQICGYELETIELLKNVAELKINGTQLEMSHESYQEEMTKLLQSIQLPLVVDANMKNNNTKMPFDAEFSSIMEPFRTDLEVYLLQFYYQNNLSQFNLAQDSTVLWKQYLDRLQEKKCDYIDETYLALADLHREFHDLNSSKHKADRSTRYYRSLVPVGSKRTYNSILANNGDASYQQPERIHKKHRIELTDIKRDILRRFEPKNGVVLDTLGGLANNEIDQDLAVLRAYMPQKKVKHRRKKVSLRLRRDRSVEDEQTVKTDEDEDGYDYEEVYEEVGDEDGEEVDEEVEDEEDEEEEEEDDDDDEIVSNISDDSSISQAAFSAYRRLLSLGTRDHDGPRLHLPEMPPLEHFPTDMAMH